MLPELMTSIFVPIVSLKKNYSSFTKFFPSELNFLLINLFKKSEYQNYFPIPEN